MIFFTTRNNNLFWCSNAQYVPLHHFQETIEKSFLVCSWSVLVYFLRMRPKRQNSQESEEAQKQNWMTWLKVITKTSTKVKTARYTRESVCVRYQDASFACFLKRNKFSLSQDYILNSLSVYSDSSVINIYFLFIRFGFLFLRLSKIRWRTSFSSVIFSHKQVLTVIFHANCTSSMFMSSLRQIFTQNCF